MDRVKRIWYLSPMRAAKVQASLRIRAVSPEPPLLANTNSESRGTFRQKARSLAPLTGWACAVKICHNGMLEDTNSLDGAHIVNSFSLQVAEKIENHCKNVGFFSHSQSLINVFDCHFAFKNCIVIFKTTPDNTFPAKALLSTDNTRLKLSQD